VLVPVTSAGTTLASRGTTLRDPLGLPGRCAPAGRDGPSLTAAVTGLPRSVLLRACAPFFRELPGDVRIDADTSILAVGGRCRGWSDSCIASTNARSMEG